MKIFNKRQFIILFFIAFFSVLFLSKTFVLAYSPITTYNLNENQQEAIKNFDVNVDVNKDASILVTENIKYDFGGNMRHGIYRDIPITSKGKKSIKIEVQNVIRDGNNENYTVSNIGSNKEIKIGDPNNTINGEHTYSVVYKVLGAIGYFDNYDELYWNVTGNSWNVPIESTNAKFELPASTNILQTSCYVGIYGSNEKCDTVTDQNVVTVKSPRALNAGEGLTLAVGFPKGVVAIYKAPIIDTSFLNVKVLWPIIIPILFFIFMFYRWHTKGRDPKGKGVIVPQYDVPDGLTPLEVGGIVNERVKNQNISAEIIYLATKGYLKITQTEEKLLGIFSEKNYEFTLLKGIGDLQDHDQQLVKGMFKDVKVGNTIKLSDLKNNFFVYIPIVEEAVDSSLLAKQYYTNLPKIVPIGKGLLSAIIPFLWISFFLVGHFFKDFSQDSGSYMILILSALTAFIIWMIFQRFMPAKTSKGVSTLEYLLGLKEYLKIAEKDRLNFHNMPDKKPEIFEKLLPYAMIFGVEELWAKEFENIYTSAPTWYAGHVGAFNAVYFGREMASFSSFTSGTLASTPGRAGSGGGGFSGGGGGGGGGGSW